MAVVADNETAQAAVASDHNDDSAKLPPAAPRRLLDPQLLMAARRGDSEQLKELLLRLTNDSDQDRALEAAAAASEVVIVDVVPRRRSPAPAPAAAAPPPPPTTSTLAALPPPLVDGVTSEGDTLLHVVAACGDGEDFLRCAKMIVNDYKLTGGAAAMRLALEARNNSNGDTPLHCAAAAGNANMISCLIDLVANTDEAAAAAASVKALARTQNKRGETALHQAVRAAKNKVACIDHLMDVDPELASIPHDHLEDDAAGASPLYLAISLGEIEIAQHLYIKSNGKLSYSGPHGRNVLHAAVHRGQALPMILKWLIKGKEDGPVNMQGGRHTMTRNSTTSSVSSQVSQLTSERDKKHKGSTPLHLAASLSGWPGARFRLSLLLFPQVWRTEKSVATLLLDANESTAYQADDEGSYPIHVAAWSNSIVVVKLLLERCPDCATLRDGNGRTFLHVAAETKNHNKSGSSVVEYVCGAMPQELSSMILNAQDSNGDTALHGAVRAGNHDVSTCLLRNRLVRLDLANKDGMTPLDLSWTTLPSRDSYIFNPGNVVHQSLLFSGAPHGGGRPDLFYEKHISKRDLVEESKNYTEATQVTNIVTALIATVAFASAFTLPGGYRADGAAAAGTAVLAGKSYAFHAFILADTLAFIFSMAATCSLVYAGLPAMDISIRHLYFNVSAVLLQSATRSLVAAFGLALYLVLAPVYHTIAVAVCAMVFATSLYGNMGIRQIIRVAKTASTRIGKRQLVVWSFAMAQIFGFGALHFGSYLIIFGLPAILK